MTPTVPVPHLATTPPSFPSRFSGASVLVTGAGSGLGRALALGFAAEGASLTLAGRGREALEETAALVGAVGAEAVVSPTDVGDPAAVGRLVAAAVERFGSLDVAVNNAGVFRGGAPLTELSDADWATLFDVNVTGVFHCLREEIARMRAQPTGGAIVNIASNLGAHRRFPGLAGYIASKAAVSALTRAAALDHAAEGVRINAVSPGPVDTAMSLRPGESPADRSARLRTQSPLGRVSSTDEVVAAVLHLASPAASSTIGADLVVDGGAAA